MNISLVGRPTPGSEMPDDLSRALRRHLLLAANRDLVRLAGGRLMLVYHEVYQP